MRGGDHERVFIIMIGAVVRASFERPRFESKVVWLHTGWIERIAEGNSHRAFHNMQAHREVRRLVATADPVETSGSDGVARPAEQSTGIKGTVAAKAAAHNA